MEKAKLGYADAQFSLGLLYQDGREVPWDYEAAAAWLLQAAEQGHAKAAYELSACYASGKGVPEDIEKAAEWMIH